MGDENRLTVVVAESEEDRSHAFRIREQVFTRELRVPSELEKDGRDANATHFVVFLDGDAIGAARLRSIGTRELKVERVAILAEFRGSGWGRELLSKVLAIGATQKAQSAVLHAQLHAVGFYQHLGFRKVGPVFSEAGVPHQKMRRPF